MLFAFLLFSLDTLLSFFLDVVLKQTSADSLKYSWPVKIGEGGGGGGGGVKSLYNFCPLFVKYTILLTG